LFGLGSTPERAATAEAAVVGTPVGDVDAVEVGRLAMSALESVPSDLHGSEDYRRRVGAEMVARAWRAASEEATRG
jgi:carbon-monoxide dehydrogenase medium subunit